MITQAIAHCCERDKDRRQTLETHLLETAAFSREFAAKISLADAGELIGLLHDFGKYSEQFQNYIKSATGIFEQDRDDDFVDAAELKGKIDHSTAGAQLIWRELSRETTDMVIGVQILSLCIASHHSGLIDCLGGSENNFGQDIFTKRMNKADEVTHLEEALKKVDLSINSKFQELIDGSRFEESFAAAIRGISNVEQKAKCSEVVIRQKIGLLARFLFSCLIDADRISTADFENGKKASLRLRDKYEEWDVLAERLEQHLVSLKPKSPIDELRQDISQHCFKGAERDKGIFTLTVPTGGGKTLASLRFALNHAKKHKMDRIIYVIPFTSIIDQNAQVVREILEPEGVEAGSILLEHHSNLTPEKQTWRGKILSENWDAPVIYTTSVQFLETLFGGGTRGARRMHQLANAVLIFDEIQTLPVNCVHLFNNAINFFVEQCASTVVLCTATQPLLHKVPPEKGNLRLEGSNELMPNVRKLFDDLKRVEIRNSQKIDGWTMEEIALLAKEEMERCGSCLVVTNTKKSAQEIYNIWKQNGCAGYHLSTSMCPAHRKLVLTKIKDKLSRNENVLCVSTQLIEAGVDIDFGSAIRFIAGLDSIAQAAGRCNRNGRSKLGVVHVVNPKEENLEMLYDIKLGIDQTARVFNEYESDPERFGNALLSPQAMECYYEYYFFKRKNDMGHNLCAKKIGRSDETLLNLLSKNSFASCEYKRLNAESSSLYLRQSFMTAAKEFRAISAPTQGVIVPYTETGKNIIADLCAAYLPDKELDILRLAQQYTVNVFPQVLENLKKTGAAREIRPETGIFYLDEKHYSCEFGLSETPAKNMEAAVC